MSSKIVSETKAKSLDESLIDLVRVNPLLFEKGKRMKPYESMKERSDLWQSIATSLGLEPNYCIARWKQLRDRYRREIMKRQAQDKQTKQTLTVDDWPLMEKMRFLDRYITQHHHHSHKIPEGSQNVSGAVAASSTATTTPQIFTGINYEEPLQEAMDDQPLVTGEMARKNIALLSSTSAESLAIGSSSVLSRIEALLGGLDQINRSIAEKRILSYLCKCQLKTLDGESVEDIQI